MREHVIETTYDGHTYTLVLGPVGRCRRSLWLDIDGVHATEGTVRYLGEDGDDGAVIEECPAAMGEDVYEHLENSAR